MNVLQKAKCTLKSSIGSPGCFPSIFLTMEKRLPCSAMCPAICGDSGPMSLPYSFELPGQLLNWLRVQGVSSKLHYFGQQVLLCGTRFQPQDCLSLLNLLLLDGKGLPAALPSTRQRMHPLISLETLKLRRMNSLQYSSCYHVSPKLQMSPDFLMQSDLKRQRNLTTTLSSSYS